MYPCETTFMYTCETTFMYVCETTFMYPCETKFETISGPVKVYFVKNSMFDLVKLGNKITQMKKFEYNIVRPHQGLPLIHNTFLHLEKL